MHFSFVLYDKTKKDEETQQVSEVNMATTFDNLPIEVQEMIFYKLPIGVLLRCKRVCKSWSHIVNSMKYESISIVKKYPYNTPFPPGCFNDRMRYNLIETGFFVNLKSADSLTQIPQQAMFKNVKRMTTFFASLPDYSILTNFYNHFENLEDLTFDMKYEIGIYAGIIKLELKSLKRCATYSHTFKYLFKTPNLKSLKMVQKRNRNCVFDFPESLEFLEVDECWDWFEFPKLFTNLRTLVVQKRFFMIRELNFIQKFPSLKELFIGFNYHRLDQLIAAAGLEPKIDIYVNGINRKYFKSKLATPAPKPCSSIGKRTRALIENRSFLKEENYGRFEIDYNQWEKLKSEEMEELDRKVKKVTTVALNSGVVDQEGLLKFLKNKAPFRLKIRISKFNQLFLARLPDSCQLLREVCFHAKKSANLSGLEFVFQLKNLVKIHVTNAFSMSFAIKLFKTHPSLEYLVFWLNSHRAIMSNNFTENKLNLRFKFKGFKLKSFSNKEMFLNYLDTIRLEIHDHQIDKLFLLLPDNEPHLAR